MSILEKLPEAPEGYKWISEVFQSSGSPTVYLHLDQVSPVPLVPEGYASTSEFCDADEGAVIKSANKILLKFHRGVEEARIRKEVERDLREKYAHLITGD